MKLNKKSIVNIIFCSVILILSVVVMILSLTVDAFALFSHPILAFLFVLNVGLCLLNLINGIIFKSPINFMVFSVTLIYLATYSLINFAQLIWWAILIIDVVIIILSIFVCMLVAGNKTEGVALNDSPEYKNYEQRKKERELEDNQEIVELPKIKSFKEHDE